MVDNGEYLLGMPKSAYFSADVKRAIIIGCSDYEQLREIEGKEGFADIPESMEDIKVVKAGLKRCGFAKEKMVILKDPEYMQVAIAINQCTADVYNDFMQGLSTLVYVYYAGHGIMDNTTYMVLNGPKMYPLEKMLRAFARADGSYVISVFDCCREKLPPE